MKILSKIALFALLAGLTLYGCKKTSSTNVFSEYDNVDLDKFALIKINYNVAFKANPSVQIKINGVRVSGTNIKTRYPFPGGGFGTLGGSTGDYLPVTAGTSEISISIPKLGTNVDSVLIYKTTISTLNGKRYSLHVADTLNTQSLLVNENFARPDSGMVRYRFVNLMANVPSIDLYNGSTLVAANVPFLGIGDEFTMPNGVPTSSGWTIRVGGSLPTSTAIATYTSSSTILQQRVYTVFANGYFGFPTSDAARRPYLSFYYVL